MPAVVVFVAVMAIFALAYRYYAAYLADRVYALDPDFVTPAHEFEDGVDYVPTNKHVLFGHHFTSVAGAAPIVGPAIAVVWGWAPALLWITLGTVFAAGVHDTGALVVSVRNKATNIGTLAQTVINPRSRTLFLAIIFFLLTLVNAVFAIVIGTLFEANPAAVIPIVAEIPLAIFIGQYIHRTRTSALVPSIVGVVTLYLLIIVGIQFPIDLSGVAEAIGMSARTLWIILLFIYGWIASRIPVWVLLQPRDYINSHQLFIALTVIFLGVLIGMDTIDAPAFNAVEGARNWFPFLFVTIACGAVSGFHSLVSSGTTSKQLDKDTDARYIGYVGALGAVLATTAGICIVGLDWSAQYPDFATASSGALGNFTQGVAGFASNIGIPLSYGTVFAAVVVVSFAATTLDTGIRLQRYIIQEIGDILRNDTLAKNITLTTTLAVLFPFALALAPAGGDGDTLAFGRLWTLFGTTNQLTAGLALAVIAVWVTKNGRNAMAQIIPLTFLLFMTVWALIINLREFVADGDWLLAPLDLAIFALAVWLIIEAVLAIRAARAGVRASGTPTAPR
ncbi:MAG TPA: carbon starvation protein A [Euzebyales bacterium]|nr:carbon starvation protein A [Euzebyales bacterium]